MKRATDRDRDRDSDRETETETETAIDRDEESDRHRQRQASYCGMMDILVADNRCIGLYMCIEQIRIKSYDVHSWLGRIDDHIRRSLPLVCCHILRQASSAAASLATALDTG